MKKSIFLSAIFAITSVGLTAGNSSALLLGLDTNNWVNGDTPDVVITDNGPGDASGLNHKISIVDYIVGNWTIDTSVVNLHAQDPTGYPVPEFDMLNLSLSTSATGGDIWILLSETDQSSPNWIASVGGTTDGTVDFFTILMDDNSDWGPGIIAATASFTAGASGSGFDLSGNWSDTSVDGEYSMILGVHIHHDAVGNTSFNIDASAPVPEPATMLLFGTGLAGLITARIRKRKQP